jgi:6-phosphogluconolactonase
MASAKLQTPKLFPAADPEALAGAVVERFCEAVAEAAATKERPAVALCGGRSPEAAYRLLSERDLPWERVDLYLTDERCVPPTDPQANAALIRNVLCQGRAAAATLHEVAGELGPQQAASRYEALLRERLTGPIDVVLLGIGEDGHIASLFPGHPALRAEPDRLVVGVEDAPKPPPQRVSLTLETLRGAKLAILIATGTAKAAALAGALAPPSELVPASLLDRSKLEVFYDPDAGRLLPEGVADGA